MPISRLDEAREAIRRAIEEFLVQQSHAELVDMVIVETPTEAGHGDLTTSFALKVARTLKAPPRKIAEAFQQYCPPLPAVLAMDVAGPGFINFTLCTTWLAQVVRDAVGNASYGQSAIGQGQRVLLEFVSSNPTGPLVIVSGRAAAVGDSLARILQTTGFVVDREFYVNDAGNQIATLGHALRLRLWEIHGREVQSHWPDGVYPGDYVKGVATHYLQTHPNAKVEQLSAQDDMVLGQYAAEVLRGEHEKVLKRFRVEFDQWFSERELRRQKLPEQIVDRLTAAGYVDERDQAKWFRSTAFGDDKDRVMVKSDGSLTYFVPDAAYHATKFDRGYDWVIDLMGPDHHGYVRRLQAVVEALGYPSERLQVMIVQLVRLIRDGQLVRMSKRGGTFLLLDDLLDDVGIDVARYFFVERAPETPMDFDIDLAQLKSSDNPVYYIQYAGARIHSLWRQWERMGQTGPTLDVDQYQAPLEKALIMDIARFPDIVARAAIDRAPQYLTRFLYEVAASFHAFYRHHRILEETQKVRDARLMLSKAVLRVLTHGLGLLGISQPEEM